MMPMEYLPNGGKSRVVLISPLSPFGLDVSPMSPMSLMSMSLSNAFLYLS